VAIGHLPLVGEEIVIVRASIVPLDALLPMADAQTPVAIAEEVALDVAAKVVAPVVFTVILVLEPNIDVTTKDAREMEAIVPNAPPKPRPPPNPRPPNPRLGVPVGVGRGLAEPPPGGVPPPPNPPPKPPPAAQPEVLVTETLRAVIDFGAAVAGFPVFVLVTATQSPVVSDDKVIDEIFEKRVEVAHATMVVPVVD
jgi:hypothetical protein